MVFGGRCDAVMFCVAGRGDVVETIRFMFLTFYIVKVQYTFVLPTGAFLYQRGTSVWALGVGNLQANDMSGFPGFCVIRAKRRERSVLFCSL